MLIIGQISCVITTVIPDRWIICSSLSSQSYWADLQLWALHCLCRGLRFSVEIFFILLFLFATANLSRFGQETAELVYIFINESDSYFHLCYQVTSITLLWVCCSLAAPVGAQMRLGNSVLAACWGCPCMSSCTGASARSIRRGRRLLCCKPSTWRQLPSEGQ